MTSIPNTPRRGDPETRRFLEAVRQFVLNSGREFVTYDDLNSQSFVDSLPTTFPPGGTDGGAVDPPSVPNNLTATGVFENIILEWAYSAYRGHAYTRIYRNTVNNFGTAAVLANVNAKSYSDPVGPGSTFYYWVTNVNVSGVESAPNQVSGTLGQTQLNPTYIVGLLTNAITETQLFSSLATRINLIDGSASVPGSVNARIATETTARTNADSALSSQITTLTASVNGNTTAIQTEATTRANADNSLFAQYTVKIDTNGYVSGYGLASTSTGATPTSSFIVRADNFAIASPSGPGITPRVPFIVYTTTQTINGVTVSPGVYISDATIANGSIGNAKIGNLAVDSAKIADASIVNAKIADASISSAKIQNAAITNALIGSAAIGTANIQNAAITTAKIGDAAVETLKIAGNAITQPIVYTASDTYVTAALTISTGGTTCNYEYVGSGGDYSFDPVTYTFYSTPGTGDYNYVCATLPDGYSGGHVVLTTSFATVGDAVSGNVIAVLYAIMDGAGAKDVGMNLLLQADTGSGWTNVRSTYLGSRVSGGDIYSVIPASMAHSATGIQQIRFRVIVGNRNISSGVAGNAGYLRNVVITVLGAKR